MTAASPPHYDMTSNGQPCAASASFAEQPIDPTATGHYLEGTAKVYLRRNPANTNWILDSSGLDGSPLDAVYDDVEDSECACDFDSNDDRTPEHRAAVDVAQAAELPNSVELLHLLADALGYELRNITGPKCAMCGRTDSQDGSCPEGSFGRHVWPAQ